MSTGKRRVFTREFKLSAIERVLAGEMAKAVCTDLQIPQGHLSNWCEQYRRYGPEGIRRAGRPMKPLRPPFVGHAHDLPTAQQQISDLQRKVEQQQARVKTTAGRLEALARQLRFTQADVDRTQAELVIHQQLLYQRVRGLDKAGGISYLELIVTSNTFTQLVNRVSTIDRVIGGDQRLVEELRVDRSRIQCLHEQVDRARAEQQQLLSQQQQELVHPHYLSRLPPAGVLLAPATPQLVL